MILRDMRKMDGIATAFEKIYTFRAKLSWKIARPFHIQSQPKNLLTLAAQAAYETLLSRLDDHRTFFRDQFDRGVGGSATG
ncbi:MAG: hypothetical protein ACK6DC_19345 [Planctomycetota bacterium]